MKKLYVCWFCGKILKWTKKEIPEGEKVACLKCIDERDLKIIE